MLATLATEPFHREGWVYEEKMAGWRMLAYKDGRHVCLVSRRGIDHAARFPDVARALARLSARTLILDGEMACFDENLISRFHLLSDPDGTPCTPPVFIAFDCVYLRGRDLRPQPLGDRRVVLERAIAGSKLIFPARRLATNGLEAHGTRWNAGDTRGSWPRMNHRPTSVGSPAGG